MFWFLIGFFIGFLMIIVACVAEHYFIECCPIYSTIFVSMSYGLGAIVSWLGYADREMWCVIGSWFGVVIGNYLVTKWRKQKNEN